MSHSWTPKDYEKHIQVSLERLRELYADWAKAKKDLERIKDREKIVVAILYKNSEGKTAKDKESDVYSSQEYQDYIKERNEALGEYLLADGAYDLAKRASDYVVPLWSHRREFIRKDSYG